MIPPEIELVHKYNQKSHLLRHFWDFAGGEILSCSALQSVEVQLEDLAMKAAQETLKVLENMLGLRYPEENDVYVWCARFVKSNDTDAVIQNVVWAVQRHSLAFLTTRRTILSQVPSKV